jgi:hypothetical protein
MAAATRRERVCVEQKESRAQLVIIVMLIAKSEKSRRKRRRERNLVYPSMQELAQGGQGIVIVPRNVSAGRSYSSRTQHMESILQVESPDSESVPC